MFARRRGLLSAAIFSAVLLSACGDSSSSSPTPTTALPALSVMLSEKTVGSESAPVTMIAYSSLSCSHCGDFHVTTYPLLKSTYIDTGRMKFVFRDFPLNDAAVAGSMVARCSGDRFFPTLDALFKAQGSWAYNSDYKTPLKSAVSSLGITSSDVDACLATTGLRDGIFGIRSAGSATYGVNATPTFIINGQKVVGALTFPDFAAIIDGM
jgi:protein-disulfide isomerase